ncbi:uncharacterized protein K452DRAFT_264950 [Aplosporella prunicola CBS 121167]|uniref:3-oxoacyl-[acyl-carrier-protein] reductase n=1 Tax=Aplosporella prunicola CBS 121167 TaxID=1176127 RepID=A0A6A6BPP6_9PEZI|nr:uncharacterized protein K452DRAFT_264950 [Aplosporella prunicola CBS 121167]KAF2145698.1 hypothetical protein K452DRAFT_264950 [Aplosporella prunicola CBS 121167]
MPPRAPQSLQQLRLRTLRIPRPLSAVRHQVRHRHHHQHQHGRSLRGLRCLVTGGSRGIGKAIATQLAAHSAQVTLVGRSEERLRAALRDLPEEAGAGQLQQHGFVAGDISTKGFWEFLVRSLHLCETTGGERAPFAPGVDVLVNAAGITQNALLMRQSAVAIENIVQTNLMGTLWACKLMAKPMLGQHAKSKKEEPDRIGPSIINVSSLLAIQGGVGSAAYATSKSGVLGLTRALAGELGPLGIRVNAILPGYIETDMTAAMQPAAREKALERIPLKRFGDVAEIADAAIFLATNQYANNCILNLDGGMSAV